MCGIAGILYADPQRPVSPEILKAMADAIAHRGPDAEGFFRAPGIGLAHRRLSIIDLSGGSQPLANEDGSVQVVFNGEIYNFLEIREELITKGHRFQTRSDTEVLVHLYEERGPAMVERLRGMFAFAIWDARQRRLLLARDRIGLKPLYVYRDDEKLLFGSELKAILAHPNVDRTIDPKAIDDYLTLGMVPGERSVFRRCRKLPPAHVLVIDAENLHAEPRRYWQYRLEPDSSRTLPEWQETLRAKIDETVVAHQIADVPVGAFLSGGLDSSIMVATQSRLAGEPVQTFSIGFREAEFSELDEARQVARQFGTRHVEEIVTPEAAGTLDELVHFYDEPFADPSALPTLWVSRLARQHVKVVISGDGGDEALGGYSRYAHDLAEARWRARLPGWLRRGLLGPIARWWPKADWLPRPLRAKTALTNLSLDAPAAYANTLSVCRLPDRHRLLAADVVAKLDGHRPEHLIAARYAAGPPGDPLGCMIAADVNTLLPDGFLTKVDRASMAFGLEVRPPLVDHELLELAGRIPSTLKIHRGQTKWLLKKTYEAKLPNGLAWRKKHGFDLPIDPWLRGPLREVFEADVLGPNAAVAELVNRPAVERMYRRHVGGVGRHGNVLWSMLILAHWAERYLTAPTPAGSAAS